MCFWDQWKSEILNGGSIQKEVLLGMTICFAQIPESVAFAYLANIRPHHALHAAWVVGFFCSAFGGRPGMINGATGAFAAIIGTFIERPDKQGNNGEGIELLFPSVILAGVLMALGAHTGVARLIVLLPSSVMLGFCNGLAVVIGNAQLHPFQNKDHSWKSGDEMLWMCIIAFTAMAVMEFFPKIPLSVKVNGKVVKPLTFIPSSLLAVVSAVVIEWCIARPLFDVETLTIEKASKFTADTAFPVPWFLEHPANLRWPEYTDELDNGTMVTIPESAFDCNEMYFGKNGANNIWQIIVQGILLFIVGSIESLLTAEVVESFVKTPGDGAATLYAMSFGNMLSGFLGGMGGNAMIGLSTINGLGGGRGRLGGMVTALGIAICVMGAYPVLNLIPVAALSGIMIVVVLHTFKWQTLVHFLVAHVRCAANIPKSFGYKEGWARPMRRRECWVVLSVTVLCVISNIAIAVLIGCGLTGLIYAWESMKSVEVQVLEELEMTKRYEVIGPIFFASAPKILKTLTPDKDPASVTIVVDSCSIMDFSGLDVMSKIAKAYSDQGKNVAFAGLSARSKTISRMVDGLPTKLVEATKEGGFEIVQL